jgi:hypothetical protein
VKYGDGLITTSHPAHWKNKADIFKLPHSVTCYFQNGSSKRLLLHSISGDSLYFQDYYNQEHNPPLRYSDLEGIRFRHRGEPIIYTGFAVFSAAAVLSASFFSYLIATSDREYGGYNLLAAYLFAGPLLVNTGLSAYGFGHFIPKKYDAVTWNMEVR